MEQFVTQSKNNTKMNSFPRNIGGAIRTMLASGAKAWKIRLPGRLLASPAMNLSKISKSLLSSRLRALNASQVSKYRFSS